MQRSAPKSGYNSNLKNQWRRQIWNVFRDTVGKEEPMLLMPSIEGHEIDMACHKGYSESQLHVVDMNPAIVAHLKRRYPRVTTYGVSVERAAERAAKNGIKFKAMNLDFCGCITPALLANLALISSSGALDSEGLMAVTVLRGREPVDISLVWDCFPAASRILRGLIENPADAERMTDNDWVRLLLLWAYTDALCIPRAGIYLSANGCQTMLWAVFQFGTVQGRLPPEVVTEMRQLKLRITQLLEKFKGIRLSAKAQGMTDAGYKHVLGGFAKRSVPPSSPLVGTA